MVLFDKFNPENFEVDNQELEILPTTTSEIKKGYPLLGSLQSWNYGEQTARADGKIISRTYKELVFEQDANDFDLIEEVGFPDPALGSRYWRVLHRFTEHEYYSECSKELEDFKIWEYSENTFQMEILYKHEILKNVEWVRPKDTITDVPGITCPPNSIVIPEGETGAGPWVKSETKVIGTGANAISKTSCYRWESINKPFYLTFDAGKALGATIDTDLTPDEVYISSTKDISQQSTLSTNSGSIADPHRMSKRYIILKWDNPGRDSLTRATVNFYGVESYRSFLPLTRDTDPEIQEHPNTIPRLVHTTSGTPTQYKPPGRYDFPDNFWNDTSIDKIENFSGRTNAPSQV